MQMSTASKLLVDHSYSFVVSALRCHMLHTWVRQAKNVAEYQW